MKHLQVPETKPNNKHTKKSQKLNKIKTQKLSVFKEFLNADREVKLIRSAGKLFHKLTTRSEKKNEI